MLFTPAHINLITAALRYCAMEYEAKATLARQLHKYDEARKYADFFKACGELSNYIERESTGRARAPIIKPH
jgi:hypothetical protein